MSRHKRTHDEIDEPSAAAVCVDTYLELLPLELRARIASFMSPADLPLLVATRIISVETDATGPGKRRFAYDAQLCDSLRYWIARYPPSYVVRQWMSAAAASYDMVPDINIRTAMCRLLFACADDREEMYRQLFRLGRHAIKLRYDNLLRVIVQMFAQPPFLSPKEEYSLDYLLIYAAKNGISHAVSIMIEAGADPNSHDGSYYVLSRAIQSHDINTVRILFQAGANVNKAALYSNWNALHVLCNTSTLYHSRHMTVPIFELLLAHEVDVNCNCGMNYMPIHEAIRHSPTLVPLLIQNGAIVEEEGIYVSLYAAPLEITQLLVRSARNSNIIERVAQWINRRPLGGEELRARMLEKLAQVQRTP